MNRSLAPEISMPDSINLLDIENIKLDNGLKVYCLDGCSEPVVNLTIVMSAGNYFQDKKFAASFASSLMKKGTSNFSANDIAEKLDFLGASLSIEAGMYLLSVSLSCLATKLAEILPIVKDVLNNSTFPEKELVIEKKNRIQRLEINKGKTNYLASIKFNEVVFGENHSCGYRPTEALINAITREDILAHYENKIKLKESSYLLLSGDLNNDIISLVNKEIGSIELKEKLISTEEPFESSKEIEFFIEKEDSVQASIRIGIMSIDAQHEDYLDLEILNRILGGFFGSRLMKNIREENGYTYGIYSYLSPYLGGSYFCIATDVGVQYKEATLNEISKEINRLKTDLVSDEELQMVKNYHKGRIMKSVDGALRFAHVLNNNLSLGLDETRINQQLKAVEEITAERLLNLANKYLDYNKMYKIVVG
ncbi:MAG: zinc protease [Planctomycetota bacterium]|jgi:zinc protease